VVQVHGVIKYRARVDVVDKVVRPCPVLPVHDVESPERVSAELVKELDELFERVDNELDRRFGKKEGGDEPEGKN
tara:strand:- start:113 stop:337 length:225 start_codon:yes stop_codon:yes gene_type:complete